MRRTAIAQAVAASEDLDFSARGRSAAGTAIGIGGPGGRRAGSLPGDSRRGGSTHGPGPPGVSLGHGRLASENAPSPTAAGQAHRRRPRSTVGDRSDRHSGCPAAARLPHPLSSYGCPRENEGGHRADAVAGQGYGRASREREFAAGVLFYWRRRSDDELDGSAGHRPARAAGRPLVDAHDYSSQLYELARRRARGNVAPADLGRFARAACGQSDQAAKAGEHVAVRRRSRSSLGDRP